MGSRMGYEYEYGLSMVDKDEIVVSSKFAPTPTPTPVVDGKIFLFETRANFIMRRRGVADVVLDSETHNTSVRVRTGENREKRLHVLLSYRLGEYWMSEDEIKILCHKAFNFATRKSNEPQHAGLDVIPIVVGLNVCTVQQEGESLDECRERAMMAEYLVPLYLWPPPFPQAPGVDRPERLCYGLAIALRDLARIRVDNNNVDRLPMREECGICSRNAAVGAQISVLPCNHAFHSHCIVRCSEHTNQCPVCHSNVFHSKKFGNMLMP